MVTDAPDRLIMEVDNLVEHQNLEEVRIGMIDGAFVLLQGRLQLHLECRGSIEANDDSLTG